MLDTLHCPVCNLKLKNKKLNNYHLHSVNNISDYFERNCTNGMNHFVQMFTHQKSKEVHFLKTSLAPNFTRFIEIDFLNKKSRISCFKMGQPEYIEVKKIMSPDFPFLNSLKEKVETFVTFL